MSDCTNDATDLSFGGKTGQWQASTSARDTFSTGEDPVFDLGPPLHPGGQSYGALDRAHQHACFASLAGSHFDDQSENEVGSDWEYGIRALSQLDWRVAFVDSRTMDALLSEGALAGKQGRMNLPTRQRCCRRSS